MVTDCPSVEGFGALVIVTPAERRAADARMTAEATGTSHALSAVTSNGNSKSPARRTLSSPVAPTGVVNRALVNPLKIV